MRIHIYILYLTIISIITQKVKCQIKVSNFTELILRNQRQYCDMYTLLAYNYESPRNKLSK